MAEPKKSVVEEYRPEIKTFVHALEYKIKMNSHKGKWEDIDILTALVLLYEEIWELVEAIEHGNVVEILLEAADTGAWGMIIADIAVKRLNSEDPEQLKGITDAFRARIEGLHRSSEMGNSKDDQGSVTG